MGRRSISGGVSPKGSDRIELTFIYQGVRYRPTVKCIPSEANLRRARKRLEEINRRIDNGTFNFADEFPDYRYMEKLGTETRGVRTCDEVFSEFLAHCQSRLDKNDMAFATFNNLVSALRCAFEYGYKDHPEKHNPATGVTGFRITKKDRPVIDPFSIQEAEALIDAIHRDWGEAQGNYDEFRFFTGLRPSEQVALLESDCDITNGKVAVTKARVMARDKDRTKTSEDRLVELCPHALVVLKRQLALRARLIHAGTIDHGHVFFKEDGSPIFNLQYPWVRWRQTLQRMQVRYRDPYNARHSSVTWNLMSGKNPLWVAKQHGHGVQTMLEVYAAWIEGATAADIRAIKQAMKATVRPSAIPNPTPMAPLQPPEFVTNTPPAGVRMKLKP